MTAEASREVFKGLYIEAYKSFLPDIPDKPYGVHAWDDDGLKEATVWFSSKEAAMDYATKLSKWLTGSKVIEHGSINE
jgi:hypothetical protein